MNAESRTLPSPAREHFASLEPCPWLPAAEQPIPAATMKIFGKTDRGPEFYRQALVCAQSLWLQGLPAQSLLLINRAFGADLRGDEAILDQWPLPFRAAAWVMHRRESGQFIGNPRRHYQHLATRMVEPRRTQRTWRAWACWWLACRLYPDCPADDRQIAEEGIIEPGQTDIAAALGRHGIPGETAVWETAVVWMDTIRVTDF